MSNKAICFNTSVICFLIAGLTCLAVGIISLVRGYKKESGNTNREKIKKGWIMSVLGTLLLVLFIPIFIKVLAQEMAGEEGFLDAVPLLLLFFYTPSIFVVAIVYLTFFLVIGISSLKEGYAQRKEGKTDMEDIVLGYVMIALGVIVLVSQILFVLGVLSDFSESLKHYSDRFNSSSVENCLLLFSRK